MNDEIIKCPMTGIELAYKNQVSADVCSYMSMANGYYTNSLMKEGEEFYEETMMGLPELYKEITWVDPDTGLTWVPNLINEPKIGMVFASGTSKNDWKWKAVKAVKIPLRKQKQHPIPGQKNKFLEYQMDMKNSVDFGEREYLMAVNHIGLI